MTRVPVQANPAIASLFYGAPAVAYTLHVARQPAYRKALATLDASINALIRARLDASHRRIDAGLMAQAREYDLINGLTGLGAYLVHRHHDHKLLREILSYLVRLTLPVQTDSDFLPGWWAAGSPGRRQSPRWEGGHVGFGLAHGLAGPLALLSITMRRGAVVNGHAQAIDTICAWFARWQVGHGSQAWWPDVIGRDELRSGAVSRSGPHRPSWCYGTPGIARAHHIAGLALGDQERTRAAEQAIIGCLTDRHQLAHLTDPGLCHGQAGLIHTARKAQADVATSELADAIEAATDRLQQHPPEQVVPGNDGLLEGTAGITLASYMDHATSPATARWDTCMLTG